MADTIVETPAPAHIGATGWSNRNVFSPRFDQRWRDAGLAGPLPDILDDLRQRLAHIRDERSEHADAVTAERQARAAALADGTQRTAVAIEATDFDAAERMARAEAWRRARALSDSLIVDDLEPRHRRIMDEAAELTPLIGTIATETQALAKTTTAPAREAWVRLSVLWVERKWVLEMAKAVVHDGIPVPVPRRKGVVVTEDRLWHAGWRLHAVPPGEDPQGNPYRTVLGHHPGLRKAADPAAVQMANLVRISHRSLPGIYVADDIAAHMDAIEAAWSQRAWVDKHNPRDPAHQAYLPKVAGWADELYQRIAGGAIPVQEPPGPTRRRK